MANGRAQVRDGVYQRGDRKGWWISFIDAKGQRRQRKAKGAHTLQQARAVLAGELQNVEKARIYGIAPPTTETFADLVARFLSHQKARLTAAAYERARGIMSAHLQPFFGTMRLNDLRRGDVQRYITERGSHVSPGSVARELNVLKRFLSLAVEWELIVLNPASGVRAPRVPAGRVRYLHPGELATLLAASPQWLRPIIGLAVSTGMRRGEILGLRHLDIDLLNSRLVLPQTKNGDGRVVYLNAIARGVLTTACDKLERSNAAVFPGISGERVSVAFKRATKSAGLEDFRFHDLRHTAASWLRMQGADIHTVAQILGHKDLRMAARYQHLSPAFLADAVQRLDGVLAESTRLLAS